MDRRVLAAIALVALVTLAGCSRAPVYVTPEVDRVESNGDGFDLQVTVDPNLVEDDGDLSDVSVTGYTLDGEPICSARFGDVADSTTRTLECEAFPSLLVADTPDRSSATVETTASLYRGQANGSHHFESAESGLDRHPGFNLTDGRTVPTAGTLQTMQCHQWLHSQDGRDFSALADAPWLEWEQRTPETDRRYRIEVANYSRYEQRNETDRFDLDPANYTHAASAVPPALAAVLRDHERRSGDTSGSEFHEVVDGLSGAEADARNDTSAALRGIRGRYTTYDDTRINCDAAPPKHAGRRVQFVETYVVHDGDTYHLRLRAAVTHRGDAFENVTAPSDAG